MKRLFLFLIAVLCGFSFISCEEEDTDYSYFIKTYDDANTSYHDIVIFEKDKYGDKIRRREIKELGISDLSQEFITEDNTTKIEIYYKIRWFDRIFYSLAEESTDFWDKKKDNIIYITGGSGCLTEQEYNEYINQ